MQDPIADLLTRIRNALSASKESVTIPASTIKANILRVLQEEGYIEAFEKTNEDAGKSNLVVKLKYYRGKPAISKIKRVSRPGLRKYFNSKQIPVILGGLGVAIISTSQGVMSANKARTLGQGGEMLCAVE